MYHVTKRMAEDLTKYLEDYASSQIHALRHRYDGAHADLSQLGRGKFDVLWASTCFRRA